MSSNSIYNISTKVCITCKQPKPISNFSVNRIKQDGLCSRCKACDKQYADARRQQNIEKIREQERIKYSNNLEKSRERSRIRYNEYRKNNLEKVREQERIKKAARLAKDPLYKMRVYIGTSIANSLSRKSYKKNSSTAGILGCTFEEFKVHIEQQFWDGMNWDNRSEWHFDHIVPVSFGDTEEEIIRLNHYTNFRPLWKNDNQSKADRLTEDAINHPIYCEIVDNRLKILRSEK